MHSCIFGDPFESQQSIARLQGGEEEAVHRLQRGNAYRGERGRSPLGVGFFRLGDGEIMAEYIPPFKALKKISGNDGDLITFNQRICQILRQTHMVFDWKIVILEDNLCARIKKTYKDLNIAGMK